MTWSGWLQIAVFCLAVFLVTKPLGVWMDAVFSRRKTFLDPVLGPVERLLYRVSGIDPEVEMDWVGYARAMLLFSLVSMLLLYLIERTQGLLGLNPESLPSVAPDQAFNTAAAFSTNTNWQAYTPETTMSYVTQMAGLAYHNFISGAVGIACAVAFIRGLVRREGKTIGNFWVDTTRALLFLFLPLCFVYALVLVSQGAIQNFRPYQSVKLLEPQQVPKRDASGAEVKGPGGETLKETRDTVRIAQGPLASQEAIKMLGTNGGGFFNANSAHPFENPTPFTNFLQVLSIFAIPAGLTYTLGRMTGSQRHGWAVFAAMGVLFLSGLVVAYWAEAQGNPLLHGTEQASLGDLAAGGNMEGKEVRFGIASSALFAVVTTDASCGAVNSAHDSLMPLGGLVPLVNILLGEIVFGGVGSGLYGMLVFVVLAVFIAGLMVGRTPEYLGKKIEAYDVKMGMLYVLIFPFTILVLSAWMLLTPGGKAALGNLGPHGLSEMLYAFTSATGNNGSAFGGLAAATPVFNVLLGLAMLVGRFLMMIPMLALAGNLVQKKVTPPSLGTFPVTTPLFVVLLVSVILIVGALTFFPALSLGPILEHLVLQVGRTF
jgi:K+-transporting ATPase ATPase A chain